MSIVTKVLKSITRILMYISYASIVALAVITVFDVIRRIIFGVATTGVTEYSQIFLIISMTALANACAEKRFVVVNEFVDKFPKGINLAIEALMGLVSAVFFLVVGWMLVGQIDSSILFKESYWMVNVPRWPFYGVLGVSLLACVFGTIVYTYEKIAFFKDPSEKTFLDEPELSLLGLTEEDVVKTEGGAE